MIRLAGIGLALVIATTGAAQDTNLRPQARPVVQPDYAAVRPVARPVVDPAPSRGAPGGAGLTRPADPEPLSAPSGGNVAEARTSRGLNLTQTGLTAANAIDVTAQTDGLGAQIMDTLATTSVPLIVDVARSADRMSVVVGVVAADASSVLTGQQEGVQIVSPPKAPLTASFPGPETVQPSGQPSGPQSDPAQGPVMAAQHSGLMAILAVDGVTDATLRPAVRPTTVAPAPQSFTQPTQAMRPQARRAARPELVQAAQNRPMFLAEYNLFTHSRTAVAMSLRPALRPVAFVQRAEAARTALRRGQVCGDPAIQGEAIGNVPGQGACGVDNAVRVRSIAGVSLTARTVINCRTADALKRWVTNGAQPALATTGGGLASIRVIGSYSCRNRNAAATGRLSEHAFGNAIDIAGFVLQDGREISVLRGWNAQNDGARLRQMWRAACGPFGTVLGPNANRFHRDHFHFDTARYRSGSYCR